MTQPTKYTVITGASAGIGHAAAKAFAGRGKNLILVARREARLEALRQEILAAHPALDVVVKTADLSRPDNAYRLYDELSGYPLDTWINNAGFGNYAPVAGQDLQKIEAMLNVNITALTLLSSLFARDYQNTQGAQLINVSSRGGYTIVPTAVTYCAAKFYVSAFTEGLAWELQSAGAPMQAKVLAPAATQTEFGQTANDVDEYDYNRAFGRYHTAEQMAGFLLQLYDSRQTVGIVDTETFTFHLKAPQFAYSGNAANNQRAVR
ncbi:MAG: SDR family NAD(P)-dependent oxidoreductase [Neisseria sp.]|nr:SDR family NAD(P)-dependent oxidoreductase [Neisseria sp.]